MPACTKRPYPTAVAARVALNRIRTAHPERGEIGIHPCSECGAFHLTSAASATRNKWTASPSRPAKKHRAA